MNKAEFKSAYGKIALSDEFKSAALEKLRAMAQGEQGGQAEQADIPEVRPKEITVPKSRRAPWKIAAGAGAAVAVIALAVWGGTYLARNANIIDPNEVQTEENLPEPESPEYYRAISGAVGTLFFTSDGKTTEYPEHTAEATHTLSEVSCILNITATLDFVTGEGDLMTRGGTLWTEYSTANGRFIVNSGECGEGEVEYIALPDGKVIAPYSCTPSEIISSQDYFVQNCLSPAYTSVSLCEERVDGRAYYSAAWTAESGANYIINAEGLTEDEMAGVISYFMYGGAALPESFGEGGTGVPAEEIKTGYGTLTVNELAVRPADLVSYRGEVKYANEEDNENYLELSSDEKLDFYIENYNIPITGSNSLECYVRESDDTEIYKIRFEGAGADAGKAIEVCVLRGDYRESRRGYCAATSAMSVFRGTEVLFSGSEAAETYLAEWRDNRGNYMNLTTKGLTAEQMSYLLAQLVEEKAEVYPEAAESVQTAYGAVNLYDFSPSYNAGVPVVYNRDYVPWQAAEFIGSDVLNGLEVPFEMVGYSLEYAAVYYNFDFDKLRSEGFDEISASYYDENLGVFISDKCPAFSGKSGTREVAAFYSEDSGDKSVAVYAISGLADNSVYGGLPQSRELEMADTRFETANDCSCIYFGRNEGDYYAIFKNNTLGMIFVAHSQNLELDEFAGVVNQLYNAEPYYYADENGDINYSYNTQRAQIEYGVKLDRQEYSPRSEYAAFGGTAAEAAERAAELTGFEGVTYLGKVEGANEMDVRAAKGMSLDADTSVLLDDGSFISLHYTGAGRELYINFADDPHLYDSRRVTDMSGRSWLIEGGDSGACVIPSKAQADGLDFTSGADPTNNTWLGGKAADGTAYYEGFRRTSGDPSEALFITVSAKGMTPREFADVMTVLIQAFPLDSSEVYNANETVDTAHGALVVNSGSYYGTGGGYMADVMAYEPGEYDKSGRVMMYTEDDMKAFSGVDVSALEVPFNAQLRELSYNANYAQFHDGYNIQLFRTGQPLEGEADDEVFREAQQYFAGSVYYYDKTAYFDNKTATMRSYTLNLCDTDNYVDSTQTVFVNVLEGDFSERYLGSCFAELDPQASEDFCAEYLEANREAFEAGSLSRVYVCCDKETQSMYGGFIKDGLHFTLQTSGLTTEQFADIMAQLYTA